MKALYDFLAVFALLCGSLYAEPARITVDWLVSGEPSRIEATAEYRWTDGDWAIYYDSRLPEAERTFERLDPQSGSRSPLLDARQALNSLRMQLGDETPQNLAWPLAFDRAGRFALYQFRNDLFMLEIASATFKRLTNDEQEEGAPLLSPDGTAVAFIREHDLYMVDTQTGKLRRLTFDGSETLLNGEPSWVYWEEIFDHRDGLYWWSPDSRSLAFLQSDQSAVSVMTFVDFQPAQPRVLTQYYPKAGQQNPSVRLGIIEMDREGVVWADLPDEFEYIVNIEWLPHSRSLAVLTIDRAQRRLDLHLVDRRTGAARRILSETDADWVDHYPPFFLADGRRFIWTSERSGYAHLYLYDLDGRLIRRITAGEWSVLPFGMYASGEQPVLAVDEKSGWVYFLSNKDRSVERQLYRARLNGGRIERMTQEAGTHQPRFSRSGRYYFDRFSSASSLPGLTLRRDDRVLATVAPARPEL
ncbi:MAG: DPP IV N-terminal domain-containing protein, partial [candidate division KSB1 bacterium]|nr:DPP IV N-terminal domain-containing protein [candidate division KSB1 bacterium]